jgi:putative ABC transport system substrate-binding protein
MRRREFVRLVGAAVAVWPFEGSAQSPGRPLVGVLSPLLATAAARNVAALREGLSEFGYVEGRNVWLEFRYADGVPARLPLLAAELVTRGCDVIVAGSAPAVVAAHGVTPTVPIVMNSFVDPVQLGVVKSIARPETNVTGIWTAGGIDALTGKRLALLKEVVPDLSRVGVMIASDDRSDAILQRLLPATTHALALTYQVYDVRTPAELEPAFAKAVSDGVQGLFISQTPFFSAHKAEVVALAARSRLPAVYGFRENAEVGGLMAYSSSLPEAYRQMARLVAKILKGAKPADLPVELAEKFELVVNNKTAKALGLKIPESFLLRADEVIE